MASTCLASLPAQAPPPEYGVDLGPHSRVAARTAAHDVTYRPMPRCTEPHSSGAVDVVCGLGSLFYCLLIDFAVPLRNRFAVVYLMEECFEQAAPPSPIADSTQWLKVREAHTSPGFHVCAVTWGACCTPKGP
jgi:hypothetical protein